jgi:hypothetical protein
MPTNGLVVYYPFNGNANDGSGNGSNGNIIGGVTSTADRFGQSNSAYAFDGTTGYISVPTSKHPLGNVTITYSCWVKPINDPSVHWKAIVDAGALGTFTRSALMVVPGNQPTYTVDGGQYISFNYVLVQNQWTHLVLTKTIDSLSFYVNDVFNGTWSFASSQAVDSTTIRIGGPGDGLGYFHGAIDDIRIYNRVLMRSEIASLYHEGGWTSLNQGLVAYYPFSGNANDGSGNGYNGLTFGITFGADRFGNQNSACNIQGTLSYVQVSGLPTMNQEHTYSAWLKVRGTGNFGCLGTIDSANGTWDMTYDNSSNIIWAYDRTNGAFGDTVVLGTTWNHVVVVYSSSTRLIYVNGVLGKTQSITTPILSSLTDVLRIGRHTLDVQQFDGFVDDIRIYQRALTGAEIDSIYHERGWGSPPSAPQLVYPGKSATINGAIVPFVWSKGTTVATQYWLEVATDSLFTFVMRDTSHSDTVATLSLPASSTYYWRVKAKNSMGWGAFSPASKFSFVLTGIATGPMFPKEFALSQNYPNPFNPSTMIQYALPTKSQVTLIVFNTLGQQVASLVNGEIGAGYHEVKLDGSGLASGVYIYRIQAGTFIQAKKLIYLR